MKPVHLLLLSILGVALVCAEVHAEDQYTEDATVVAVDDSAAAMEDLDEEMEDTRRSGCSAGFTHYKAKFDTNEPLANGFTGTFRMKICNDGSFARYKSDFSGPFASTTTNLNYHLHSKYVEGSSDLKSTSGHYDPTYKCGGASSFKASPFCSADDYTPTCSADKTKCELGDTSGKMGQLTVEHLSSKNPGLTVSNGAVDSNGWSAKDMNPPRIEEYSETGGATGATFSSVIFHFCTSGTEGCSGRLFGGSLQKTTLTCPHHTYGGVFDGSPINGGVTGKFIMRICKDGSMARYNGRLNLGFAQQAQIAYFASDSKAQKPDGSGNVGPYSPNTVTGTVDATITTDGKLKVNWSLNGLESESDGGIHIHYGNSCDNEASIQGNAPVDNINTPADPALEANAGHYYDPANQKTDPWSIKTNQWDTRYCTTSAALGGCSSTGEEIFDETQLGAPVKSALNRVVIVHNSAGGKIGCGVLKPESSLKYHVHTKYDSSTVANTGDHYDPTYKCGGKSANQGDSECEGSYPSNGYELGDLSGRNGNAGCNNGECIFRVTDTDPPHNCDFVDSASGTGQGNQFASIVFHRASTGAKYFGVALEKVH